MSLNKFFDVNTGYDVCNFDIGALEMKCDDLETTTINGGVWDNGLIKDVNYDAFPASCAFGDVVSTSQNSNILIGGGSKKSLLITGNMIVDGVKVPISANTTILTAYIDISPYFVKFPPNESNSAGRNYLCGTASATLRDFTTPTSSNSYNMGCWVSYDDAVANQLVRINCIRYDLNIGSTNPERQLFINYSLNLPLED